MNYPAAFDVGLQDFTYSEFICLNDPAGFDDGDQPDGNVTFWFQADVGQVTARQPGFFAGLSSGDLVRVTGALVFGSGNPGKLEIHPVYAVEMITATFAADLSGAWADDAGNTYYLRHDVTDDSVWYAAVSPLGGGAFGQVFRGGLLPGRVAGEVVALDLGYGTAPPPGVTGSRIGDTGVVTFGLGRTELGGRAVPMLATGDFRLVKLYDA